MKRFRSFISVPSILTVLIFGVSAYFLYWKFQLGLVRYFDIDELAYLWWANHLHQGVMPYQDFFFFATPGFLWFLSPVFAFFHGATPLIVGRILMGIVFSALTVVAGVLFWEMRRSWLAVAVPLFLVFLPLPADKFLEIRPDSLSLLFVLLGIVFLVYVMNREVGEKNTRNSSAFLVGSAAFSFSWSLVILQKTLPIVCISGICFLGWYLTFLHAKSVSKQTGWRFLFAALVGGGIVVVCTMLWFFLRVGDMKLVWYSLIRLPMEINELGKIWIIEPTQFFYPNDTFYGMYGYHIGYVLNILLWCGSILIGIMRLFTPVVHNGKKGVWQEFMISGIFISSLILYKSFFPMKHAQYLMPIAIFVAWYAADGFFIVWNKFKHTYIGRLVSVPLWCLVLGLFVKGYWVVNAPKFFWRNDAEIQTVATILRTIPQSEAILDLVGLTMYYPAPYYFSCLPIGQIVPLMSLRLPSLSGQLEKTDTKFIYQGTSRRVTTLSSEDQAYIAAHFVPVGDGTLLVRADEASSYVKILSK